MNNSLPTNQNRVLIGPMRIQHKFVLVVVGGEGRVGYSDYSEQLRELFKTSGFVQYLLNGKSDNLSHKTKVAGNAMRFYFLAGLFGE